MTIKNKKLLVTLANESYLDQAKQLFSSVYFNAGWDGDYMLLAHDIPEEKLVWFRDKGILIKKCSPIVRDNYKGIVSQAAFSKFYLFETDMKKWEKIIFLDGDIIVKNCLTDILEGNDIIVVRDRPFNKIDNFGRRKIHYSY